jgi:hypothetical protein
MQTGMEPHAAEGRMVGKWYFQKRSYGAIRFVLATEFLSF